ncbi:MAG TPA: bifunctional UDP-N-acetylglucosamine diphosphorylase/glucosamine-1-phosphate N-acetyltransferase GlmU [Burkholderiales bacterium]|nr:bifunctional UDP-N-acetylglucosamine diphosphorylase/glucosamine-1-phosphate N-acetyltransferase GlmU [Burkholderiales bacterium]
MSPLSIVILAAGLGKRMRSDLPKVLHPLAGWPLLAHVLATARSLEPARLCVVYGHGGEIVPKAIGGSDITWVKQDPQLGTGHAVLQALPHLAHEGLTLILYGDVPLTSRETLVGLLAQGGPGTLSLLTVNLADPTGYGRIVRNKSGAVSAIVEEKDAGAVQRRIKEVNTGIMALPSEHLHDWLHRLENRNAQAEYYLTDVVAMAVKAKLKVQTAQPAQVWETLGVNSKAQLAELERVLQRERAQGLLEAGVTLVDPARLDIRGELRAGRDVSIDVGCVFEGQVTLGDGVRVGAYCVIRDAVLGAGTEVLPFSHVENFEAGRNCRIGPYSRIRPGTRLAEDVHVGNFVEVKNSQIGDRSKANHLSYVGDSTVGRDVNIGAGTITCNYDGANKHRTVIEDDAFIGSNAALVAPVTVGQGATVGAGSTISKDAPAGQLTISRAKQVSLPSWKRPIKKPKV